MADKKQQSSKDKQKKKNEEQQDWAGQSGKNPDDLEIFSQPKKL